MVDIYKEKEREEGERETRREKKGPDGKTDRNQKRKRKRAGVRNLDREIEKCRLREQMFTQSNLKMVHFT